MGIAQREMMGDVMRVLHEVGAVPIDKGYDGGGHQTITFDYNQKRTTFHYPCTGRMNGNSRRNVIARLRRIIREIPEPTAPVVTSLPPLPVQPVSLMLAPAPPPPTPPDPKRMTAERRRELAKFYLTHPLVETAGRFNVTPDKAREIILSQRGQAADKLKREANVARMEAARRTRPVPSPPPPPPITRQERNRRIKDLYLNSTTTLKEIGRRFGVSISTAWRIARR